MADLGKEAYGPLGDAARHRQLTQLEAGLRALPDAPRDRSILKLIVCRQANGVRTTPDRVSLTREEGVMGDGWSRRPSHDVDSQITVMRRDFAELIANGQSLTLFGDNLFVDLDISSVNLPAGTRLRVGEALVEVSPKPHKGCLKFRNRFGGDALRFVQAQQTRHRNLRGVHGKVVAPGIASVGVPVQVLSRPRPTVAAVQPAVATNGTQLRGRLD